MAVILSSYVGNGTAAFITAASKLAGGLAERIARESLRGAGDKTRTQVRRALREQMGVKTARVVTRSTRSYVTGGGLVYVIEGRGKGLPIEEFKGLRVTSKGVRAAPWNVMRLFKRSFANGGYRARLGAERFPVRRLYGPSPAKEIVKDRSVEVFEETAPRELEAQLSRRLARLLP